LALRRDKNDLAALAAFDRSIALISPGTESRFYYLWKYRALTLKNLKRYEESLGSYDRAISLEPTDTVVLTFKAYLLTHTLERYPESIKISDRIIAIKPSSSAYENRAHTKRLSGDLEGRIADYGIAIKLDPKEVYSYHWKGIAKYSLGDVQGGLIDSDLAISINPKFDVAYGKAAFMKYDLGDVSGAIDYWRKSLSLKPDNPDAQLGLAIALYKQGKEAEAYKLGIAAIKKERRSTNLDFLRKNDWSENMIKDAVKFFQTPQIAAIR
jgi:tetratricopeptide (TPR) repeat protein